MSIARFATGKLPLDAVERELRDAWSQGRTDDAARWAGWLSAAATESDGAPGAPAIEAAVYAFVKVGNTRGVLGLLSQDAVFRAVEPIMWLWNNLAIYLQRHGAFVEAIGLLERVQRSPHAHPLLERRLGELRRCADGSLRVPYFRAPTFDEAPARERYLLDEAIADTAIRMGTTLPINGASGAFHWPREMHDVDVVRLELHDATVLSDCSVLVGKRILYETIKTVQHSWRHTHARTNDYFGQYCADDAWVQLTTTPKVVAELDQAFLVPNPTAGVGHFIHDALGVHRAVEAYLRSVAHPRLLVARLRDYDRAVIEGLMRRYWGDVDTVELAPGSAVRVARLHACTTPFSPSKNACSSSAIRSIQAHARAELHARVSSAGRKIFITREDGQNIDVRARIDDIVCRSGIVEELGFERVALATLDLDAQLSLFASAAHVAGVHGAGLMNIAFARDGLRVTELVTPAGPNYYTIAMFCSALGYDYRAVDTSECFDLSAGALTHEGRRRLADALQR